MYLYSYEYYSKMRDGARRSALEIVPLVIEWIQPRSVVDVGCGVGTWLSVFQEFGVKDILGIDGRYISKEQLEIPEERFRPHDLETSLSLDRSFDLVLSLEVAEHIRAESADDFIGTLVQLGPVILFSAAVPYQGGENHVNEQWPAYWAERFEERRYLAIDILRNKIWQNDAVDWWYAQNTILYVRKDCIAYLPAMDEIAGSFTGVPPVRLHPKNVGAAWRNRALGVFDDIMGLTPSDATVILVDDAKLGTDTSFDRVVLPFLEKDGTYRGQAPDDDVAISELERMKNEGAGFLVFAWPSFWWLSYYSAFSEHVRSMYRCVHESEDVIIFDVR